MKEKRNNKKTGITLVALVITIVIMLILASVTIGAINGGLFDYAGKAKISTEESSKMEGIKESFILAKETSKTGRITATDMQHSLDKIFGANYAEAIDNSDTIVVKIDEKYYEVDSKGNVAEGRTLASDPNAGDITKGGTCTGTQANPYRIECIEDLVKLSMLGNNNGTKNYKYYLLTKDLDFNSIFSYANYRTKYSYDEEKKAYIPDDTSQTTIKELCTTGQGFIPISLTYGNDGSPAFHGIFYGKEQREIKNIYINRSGVAALFGAGSNATIKNITIDGTIISTSGSAAGFVGTGWGTTIQNCINKAKIVSKTSCAAGIRITGGTGKIINCINVGDVVSESNCAAGICYVVIDIDKCRNSGTIKGKSGAFGIAYSRYGGDKGTIKNCINTGTILCTGTGSVGGLTYSNDANNKIYNCYNVGTLKQENSATPRIARYKWG